MTARLPGSAEIVEVARGIGEAVLFPAAVATDAADAVSGCVLEQPSP
jgi:hypothetical protein